MSGLAERTVHTTDDQLMVFSDRRLDAESSKVDQGVELRLADVTEIDGREWIQMTLSDGSSRFALGASVRSHTDAPPDAVPSAPAVHPVLTAAGTATAATTAPSKDSTRIGATPAAAESGPASRSRARLVVAALCLLFMTIQGISLIDHYSRSEFEVVVIMAILGGGLFLPIRLRWVVLMVVCTMIFLMLPYLAPTPPR
jgi:hypothetical protein